MTTPNPLPIDVARTGRDHAMAAAEAAANQQFKITMFAAIRWVAQHQKEFISDDLWDALDTYHPTITTTEPRVMGPLMVKAVKAGICERTGRYRSGRRHKANATAQPIYRSLIHQGEE